MGNSPYSSLILIAMMVVAFYFLIVRPQKKRQQAQQETLNSLQPGTRVLLGSGLFGTLTWVGQKQAVIEVSPGVEMTVLKQAVVRTVRESDEDPELRQEWEDEDTASGEPEVIEPGGVDPSTVEVRSQTTDPTFDAPAGEKPQDPSSGTSSAPNRG